MTLNRTIMNGTLGTGRAVRIQTRSKTLDARIWMHRGRYKSSDTIVTVDTR